VKKIPYQSGLNFRLLCEITIASYITKGKTIYFGKTNHWLLEIAKAWGGSINAIFDK
jgi:hypothetical protein